MTLNITVLTENTIYQSADFRLTNIDTKQLVTDTSTKLVTLQYGGWDGFVSYTGIGRWEGRDTSEFVIEWLTGLKDATFEDVATQIRDKGDEWLYKIEAAWRRPRHTFILGAFEADRPKLALVSNFEDCFGRNDAQPRPSLTISRWRFEGRPLVAVTGWKPAVRRFERRRLERLIRDGPDDPARIRRRLAEINAEAADSAAAQDMISRACSVVSFRADGRGVCDVQGPVVIRNLAMGMAAPDLRRLTKLIGFGPGHIAGMTFASSKARVPYAPCSPRIIEPAAGSYTIREATHNDFDSCRALDVSNAGVVLGDGSPLGPPGDYLPWTSTIGGEPKPCGFIGKPGGINDAGEVAAEARMSDGSVHAVRWRGEAPVDLGCFRGSDSGAVATNAAGLVVGWVCVDSVNRGQINFRPTAWSFDRRDVLENFGCDWGQAVDVNDAGIVLVVGYVGMQCRAILWNPLAGTTEVIGDMTGIYPTAITADGVVLGTARDRDGKSVAWLARRGERWGRLGTEPGFYATSMNNAGDIVGAVVRDGYEKPWLRRASGEIVRLPYFDQHWCRPSAINDSGVIVGTAQTDHGTHALVWTP